MSAFRLCRLAALGLLATTASAPAGAQTPVAAISADDLAAQLARSAPKADRRVLQLAAHAMRCALQRPELGVSGERLSVIDYSRPSTEPRMWVFDLARQRL
ncbi:MAG: murein L,D-transpeptidase catalytic domain-containing protein, partial [Stenotrophomonas lactitubi]